MHNLSYNLSPNIRVALSRVERQRQKIILAPLPRNLERKLRWEALIQKIYWPLRHSENSLTRKGIGSLLSRPGLNRKTSSSEEKEALNYKSALDYIDHNWYVTANPVESEVLVNLFNILSHPTKFKPDRHFKTRQKQLNQVFAYLEAGSEHPVVQSAIAQIQLKLVFPFGLQTEKITRLLGLLYLYKYGYDARGLLVPGEFISADPVLYTKALATASQTQNLTIWLEYYTSGILRQMQKAWEGVRSPNKRDWVRPILWELNARQQGVLLALDNPEAKLTNREVKKLFKVSQITAARDLSKLVKLNLLASHGKGRSVFYTRV